MPLTIDPECPPAVQPASTALKSETDFFDSLASEQGDFNPFAPRGWQTLRRRFVQLTRPPRSASLLDVGCGTGQSRQIYMGSVSRYVGIDLSAGSLRIAQRNLGTGIWAQGDACKLPFPDDSFDVVAFSSVLHHLPACELALREAHRVLKAGGAAFAFDPNLLNPVMATFRWPSSPLYIANGVSPNESPVLPGRLRATFKRAGFGPIQQRCQSSIPFRRVAKTALSRFLPLYNAGDWVLDRIGLGRWFGSFVITVGQKAPRLSREAA